MPAIWLATISQLLVWEVVKVTLDRCPVGCIQTDLHLELEKRGRLFNSEYKKECAVAAPPANAVLE